jgi:hypothetical protein
MILGVVVTPHPAHRYRVSWALSIQCMDVFCAHGSTCIVCKGQAAGT